MDNGTYILLVYLDKTQKIKPGKLPEILYKKGIYLYVGRALTGLQARINRHTRSHKKIFWHIDYLLEYAGMIGTRKIHSIERRECALSGEVGSICHSIPMVGFGSSDCGCTTHLYFFSHNPLSDPRFERIWG